MIEMVQTGGAVLSIVIRDNSLVPILLSSADKGLFPTDDQRVIYDEIKKLHEAGVFFDFVILGDRLSGKIENPHSKMSELLTCLAHTSPRFLYEDFKVYVDTLKREQVRGQLESEINGMIKRREIDPDRIQEILSSLKSPFAESESGRIDEDLLLSEDAESGGKTIQIGIPTIDRYTGGFRLGETLLVMSRTAVGKSFLAMSIIDRMVSLSLLPVAYFSLEMARMAVLERMVQVRFNLTRSEALPFIRANDSARHTFLGSLKNLRLFCQSYSINELELKIKETGSKVVIIDYLDLLGDNSKREQSRYERISDLIVGAKRMAKRHNILMIILHQLQRQAEDGSVPVRLTMARDSGVIEEASDFIIGAWRPEIGYEKPGDVPEDMKKRMFLKLLKNKRGGACVIPCYFDNNGTGKIWEVEERSTQEENKNEKFTTSKQSPN